MPKLALRTPMPIHSLVDLDILMYPVLLFKVYDGPRVFTSNGWLLTTEYMPADYTLFRGRELPDGLDGVLTEDCLYIYDYVTHFTSTMRLHERLLQCRNIVRDVPKVAIVVPEVVVSPDEVEYDRTGVVYLRNPLVPYYQKPEVGKRPEPYWYKYIIPHHGYGTIVEVVDTENVMRLILRGQDGNEFDIWVTSDSDRLYLRKYQTEALGKRVHYIKRGSRRVYKGITTGVLT